MFELPHERGRTSWASRCRSGTGVGTHAPLRSGAGSSVDTEGTTVPGLAAAMHSRAELAPICAPGLTYHRERQLGHNGEKEEGKKAHPCCIGTLHWQIVHTQRCSLFIGIRGTKHSSNHIRDLTRMVDTVTSIVSLPYAYCPMAAVAGTHRCGTWDRSSVFDHPPASCGWGIRLQDWSEL